MTPVGTHRTQRRSIPGNDGPGHVLVLVHAVRTAGEREVHDLVLGRLRERGHRIVTIAWDRGMAFLDLEAHGEVHEIEAINRWRLPQVLARVGLRPVARVLRQRRVRAWWGRGGPPDAVLVLGRIRPEVAHYLPPDAGPVTLLLVAREPEAAESLEASVAVADRVIATDRDDLDAVRELVPDLPAATVQELVAGTSPASAEADGPILVTGVGPGDWRGAPDLFLRVAAALPPTVDGRPLEFGWVGVDPEDGRSFPYLYDTHHLGLDGRITWLDAADRSLSALGRSSAVVLTGRSRFPFGVHAFVDAADPATFLTALGAPVLGFDTPALDPLAPAAPARIEYPDVAALVDGLAAQLATPARPDLAAVVDAVVDPILGPP